MGLNGTDVAREAGDIVLLDDNFASIVIGIQEGRLLFDNLKKSIAYTLAHLPPEIIPVLFWAVVGTPLAMSGILTLCIDLLTEVINHKANVKLK
jgi:sodium/potassium-transporting ATPase subunit alpha